MSSQKSPPCQTETLLPPLFMPTHSSQADAKAAAIALRKREIEIAISMYGARLLAFLTKRTKDPHLAEDLSQELWQHVYTKWEISKFTQYGLLQRKAYQLFIAKYRSEKLKSTYEHVDAEDVSDEIEATPLAPASRADEILLQEKFWEQFGPLNITEVQKHVMWLLFYEQRTIMEVSDMLGVPVSTLHGWCTKVRSLCLLSFNKEIL